MSRINVGIVHRDLKTANLMRDSKRMVRVMDFGMAKRLDAHTRDDLTSAGKIVGTPEYMSPEQARDERLDARSDVYSFGIVLFELLTGDLPFRGDSPVTTLLKQIQEPPPLSGPAAGRIPPALVPVLRKALSKSPDARFASARDLAVALRRAQAEVPIVVDQPQHSGGKDSETAVYSTRTLTVSAEERIADGVGREVRFSAVKVKEDADKLAKAGQLAEAIALYRQIAEENPEDWNTVNKIGDLYAKLNKNREAGDEYARVADFYAKDGFLLKAIAIWKKIQKLDASALDPYLKLAELYAKQGLMMEAKSQYQIVVDEFMKRGKLQDAGDFLSKMTEIDPGDLKVRSKLADLYAGLGETQKAIAEHIAIATELRKKGFLAEARQILEKGQRIAPGDAAIRAAMRGLEGVGES